MCSAQIFFHPALVANLYGIIYIAIVICNSSSNRARIKSVYFETHLIAIYRSSTILGVCSHIVVAACVWKNDDKITRATTIIGMTVVYSWVWSGADTQTFCGDSCSSIIGYTATTDGCCVGDIDK